ncbi:MAG: winged helix-turn-helix domain-containing protein [Bryobacterales bacterium]|nr:winged helix-turn-helix domain-containing protein [Bryobacterales bacterium]
MIRFGVFELDPETGELRKSGVLLRLQPQPAKVLVLLASRPGEVVTREEIREHVWGSETFIEFDQGLNHCIKEIRAALGDQPDAARFIQTLPRRGYRFIAPVETDTPPPAVPQHPRLRIAVVVLAVFAAIGIGAAAALFLRAPPPAIASLAVLPFQNFSGDPDQQYFSDGMTDALITDLSRIHSLRVISRTSVMRYRDTEEPLPAIARELGVDAVLEGSVVRDGNRVRVTAQLVEAATDRHLWAESYEREMDSILALQNEIVRNVTREVRVRLEPREEARLASARPINPATYEAYLRGMFHLNKATAADSAKGLEYLKQAVALDPGNAMAHAGLALGYIQVAHSAEAWTDSLPRAKEAASTAIQLDPNLAEASASLGFVAGYWEWDWDEAFRHIERAIELSPSMPIAYYHRSWFNALFGRMPEAIADHERGRQLDPFNPLQTGWLAELYRWEGRYAEATAGAEGSIEIAPGFPVGYFVLGLIRQEQGRYDDALTFFRKAAEVSPAWRWVQGLAYGEAGRQVEARKLLAELNGQPVDSWTAFWRMAIHAALGEMDEAFRWLRYEPHHAWLPWVRVLPWPGLTALRQDPRFPAELRRMNLPPLED